LVTARVRLLVGLTVAAAAIALAAATFIFPIGDDIGGPVGVAYWTILTLIASALPVRLPTGTVASVSFAPIMASIVLGGPTAGAIVTAIGTTDTRELKGEVPWYGTLFNHAALVIAAVIAGIPYELLAVAASGLDPLPASILQFGALVLAGLIYSLISAGLAVVAVSLRTGAAMRTVLARDIGAIAPNLLGLAPLGWLMAQIFLLPDGIGWWATTLFVIPLFTTRLAYHRYVETRELFEQTIGALANAVDARDRYTRGHSNRVSHITEAMCRAMNLPESQIETIKWAGLLHDVGKIGIRDNILLKPGPLNREERILMNQHPTIGAEIVAPASQLAPEAPLIRAHHEWINGSGYPDGLEYADIPIGARVMTIADAYEAMTSSRPYRLTPLSHEQAVAELEKYAGLQFDPEIVPVLVGLDRSILDRPPERPDELPTMLRQDDLVSAAAGRTDEGSLTTRPALASDDAP
jgi:putative nucleotidyltransferase with HDIG domain